MDVDAQVDGSVAPLPAEEPPQQRAPEGIAADEAAPPPSPSCLRVYALSVATFGLYSVLWTYRTARRLDPEPEAKPKYLAWGLASFCPPIYALVLYEIGRTVRERFRRRVRYFDSRPSGPALLYAIFMLLFSLTSMSEFTSPLWLLFPIPLVWVHAGIRKFDRVRVEARGQTLDTERFRRWEVVTLVIGLPAAIGMAYVTDETTARIVFAPSLEEGAQVSGASELYTLRVYGSGWRQCAPGTTEDGSDLELLRPGGGGLVIVHVRRSPGETLDQAVAARRAMIAENNVIRSLDEKRTFLLGTEFVPVSNAVYKTGDASALAGMRSLIVVNDGWVVDLLAISDTWQRDSTALLNMAWSFRLASPEEE